MISRSAPVLDATSLPTEKGSNPKAAKEPAPGKVVAGAFHSQGDNYKVDSEDFMLRPGEAAIPRAEGRRHALRVESEWEAVFRVSRRARPETEQRVLRGA